MSYDRAERFKRAYAANATAVWLTEHYGERCPEFEPTCENCTRWQAFDRLFQEESLAAPAAVLAEIKWLNHHLEYCRDLLVVMSEEATPEMLLAHMQKWGDFINKQEVLVEPEGNS